MTVTGVRLLLTLGILAASLGAAACGDNGDDALTLANDRMASDLLTEIESARYEEDHNSDRVDVTCVGATRPHPRCDVYLPFRRGDIAGHATYDITEAPADTGYVWRAKMVGNGYSDLYVSIDFGIDESDPDQDRDVPDPSLP